MRDSNDTDVLKPGLPISRRIITGGTQMRGNGERMACSIQGHEDEHASFSASPQGNPTASHWSAPSLGLTPTTAEFATFDAPCLPQAIKGVQIGFFQHLSHCGKNVPLDSFLNSIKTGTWAAQVEEVRAGADKSERDRLKRSLPAAMLSGTTKGGHKLADVLEHSGLLQIDLDHVDDMAALRDRIGIDRHILAAWISPSGTGVKAIMLIPPDAEGHKAAFVAAENYMRTTYAVDIDKTCSDLNRMCFVSYDPALVSNPGAVPLDVPLAREATTPPQPPQGAVTLATPKIILERARAYLTKLPVAVSGQSGDKTTYKAAVDLVRGFKLSVDEASPLLAVWNERCEPPWSEGELRYKLTSAATTSTKEPGYLLIERSNTETAPGIRPLWQHSKNDLGNAEVPVSLLTVPHEAPPVDNVIILPGNGVTITECAEKLFTQIAATETMFLRGGEIVEVLPDGCDRLHLKHIPPTAFRSRFEKFGQPFAWRVGANHHPVLKPTVCPEETAKALMASEPAHRLLPPISLVTGCPVAIRVGDTIRVLMKGYHRDHFGILITTGAAPIPWDPRTAVGLLNWLIYDFDFVSPGDRARAFAMLLTPALKMGGIIKGPIPIGVLEADQSQAGKGFFTSLVAAVYNDQPVIVPQRKGGVGSYDESFSQALVNGTPFVLLDNFRGKLDSAYIESFLTAPGTFPARVPNRGSIDVEPARFVLMMTSNGVEMTPDLANRSSIVRIRKRERYAYRSYQDGDLIQFVHAHQGMFLGAVFSLIAEWFRHGRPRTNMANHDFREWGQTLDWIVQWAGLGPLLAEHRSAQVRVSSPATTLLRKLALTVQSTRRLEQDFTANDLCTLCKNADVTIEIPGLLVDDKDQAMKQMGSLMAKLFGERDTVTIESFQVYRRHVQVPRPGGGHRPGWLYRFTAAGKESL